MSYTLETSVSTHVLQHIRVLKYRSADSMHMRLSGLALSAHVAAKRLYQENESLARTTLKTIENEIEDTVAELYGITQLELNEIQKTLTLLKEGKTSAGPTIAE